jgi:hypothetical protein
VQAGASKKKVGLSVYLVSRRMVLSNASNIASNFTFDFNLYTIEVSHALDLVCGAIGGYLAHPVNINTTSNQ